MRLHLRLHLSFIVWCDDPVQPLSFVEVFAEQQIVVVTGEMSHQLLERVKVQRAEAALVLSTRLRRIDDVPMHRAQMLQQVRLLLEHRHAQATCERLLAGVHAQMRLQIPRHSELLSAILATVLAHRIVGVGVARRARALIVVAWVVVGVFVLFSLLLQRRLREPEQVMLTAGQSCSQSSSCREISGWRSMRPRVEWRRWRQVRTRLTSGIVTHVTASAVIQAIATAAIIVLVIRIIGGMAGSLRWRLRWRNLTSIQILEI